MRPGIVAALLPFVIGAALVGCGDSSAEGDAGRLTLAAYSTPREAYEVLIPAFGRTEAGAGVGFDV
ncbi:MAG: hypothetical protein M3321_12680 [Actinomycetota bacterium]|nr:hypothetical protein [Actinomycetota bacterium]